MMPMFVKMGLHSTGFQGAPDNERRRRQKFAARRAVKPGYPWDGRFETKEEVDRYFSGNKIECLLCGKTYRTLGVHILKIHGMPPDAYRQRYGLGLIHGLSSAATTKAHQDATPAENVERLRPYWGKYGGDNHRKYFAPYRRAVSVKNGLKAAKRARDAAFGEADKALFLQRVACGLTPSEVIEKFDDSPRRTVFFNWTKNDVVFAARLAETIEALPFHVQSKAMKLGAPFRRELRRLFDQGLSDHKAARVLGVTAMTCNKITRYWRTAAAVAA